MKIRSDYVSNSSSSSFVVVLTKNYPFKDFVKDVVKACSEDKDYDYNEEFVKELDDNNRRNLEYCLNTYELLFLGSFKAGTFTTKITGKRWIDEFKIDMKNMDDDPDFPKPKVLSESDDEIEIEEPIIACGITVDAETMHYNIVRWHNKDVESDQEYRKRVVENIVDCAKKCHDECSYSRANYMGLYEITMNTIENTERLIAEGYSVDLDKWCSDLDQLKRRINEGERIFGIEMGQGGNGQDSKSIYALNGWDSDFNKHADVQVLSCECG